MQADDLGLLQHLVERQVAHAQGLQVAVGIRVVGQQLAAEAGHDAGKGGADLAGADNAYGLAVQIEANQAV